MRLPLLHCNNWAREWSWRHGIGALLARSLAAIVVAGAAAVGSITLATAGPVTIGGPFTLTAPDGTSVTDATYRGRWLVVFFGYTSCPDECPTTLMELATALKALGSDAAKVQPIFVTVDPAHDTPAVMGQYVAAFDPRIVGLTGTPQQIAAVGDAYGADAMPHDDASGDHPALFDHSTYLYVMNPDGQFVRGLSFDTPGDEIAETLRTMMARPQED